ncbi:class I SAM-dependent methyltransferase [Thioalkalicoccus limnaeus]|uniref:Class I SAM-dependent methyltransferase n=1 Tax=Thioalkalicoccus limnaeus TaxID=120681 RepID=A0ABV4BHZ8_9GAMM
MVKHKHSQLAALLMKELSALPLNGARVLEVNCERGWFAGQLQGCSSFLGIDPSAEMVAEAQAHFPHAKFFASEFLPWEAPEQSFDLILYVDKIAHTPDQEAVLEKMGRLVRPGGHLVLTTENPFVYSRICWIRPPAAGEFRRWLTNKELHAMLGRSGWRVERSYTVLPAGELGVLKIINARRLNDPLQRILPGRWITRVKEWAGLGQFRVVVAQRSTSV